LGDDAHGWHELASAVEGDVFAAADLDGDGRVDLAGLAGGRPVRYVKPGIGRHH
jgi:hypothetical protein